MQVLIDWELGDMTGLEVLTRIKQACPDRRTPPTWVSRVRCSRLTHEGADAQNTPKTTARLIIVSGNDPSQEDRHAFEQVRLGPLPNCHRRLLSWCQLARL